MQNSLTKQAANVKWFEEGDCNTNYFHSMLREKRRKLQLNTIKNHNGNWIHGEDKIVKASVKYFNSLFNLPPTTLDTNILDCITKNITDEYNDILSAISTEDEIRNVVFNLSATSTSGPDGYNGTFFHCC